MRDAPTGSGKIATILAIAGRLAGLDQVGLYALSLAKRTGMNACLLLILNEEEESSAKTNEETIKKKFQEIQKLGAETAVLVNCLLTTGNFVDEVVNHLLAHEIAIVVVSEGQQPKKRSKELREIKRRLALAGKPSKTPQQFLLVAKMEAAKSSALGKPLPFLDEPQHRKGN